MSLRRNTLWNLAGASVPLLAAVFAIPYLLKGLGAEAFGVLTLIWALIGYFSLFDIGVGRALTYEVSRRVGADRAELGAIVRAGITLTLVTGLLGALIVAVLAGPLTYQWLGLRPELQSDVWWSLLIAALGVIPTTVSSGLRGTLEGLNRFAASNVNRLVLGSLTFILPAWSQFAHGSSLCWMTLYVVAARFASMIAVAAYLREQWENSVPVKRHHMMALLDYGFWITLTGIVGPLMVYGDRFFVGAVVGVSQLPAYAIPQEALQRLLIIPAALCGALLPHLSAMGSSAVMGTNSAWGAYRINLRRVAIWMALICGFVAALSYPAFSIWISPQFADSAITVTLILALGIWINSLALVPYTVMHALGKPKITALFHLLELLLYLAILWPLVRAYGLAGAAIAWTLRITVDCMLLHTAARRATHGH